MVWVSEHFVRYSREVASSDTSKPNLLVSFGANRYEDTSGHTDQYDWSCTCEDWTYRKSRTGGYCKHIEHVQGLTPQQGGRSLWKQSKIDKPLMIPDEEALKEMMACTIEHPNHEPEGLTELQVFYTQAQKALYKLNDSIKMYTPVPDRDGNLISAVYLPDTKPAFTRNLTDAEPLIATKPKIEKNGRGGTLNGTQFGAYLLYQDQQTQTAFDVCKDMGFDPRYYFMLEPDGDPNTPCSDCRSHMTRITSIDPNSDGYVCTNPECLRNINSAANKAFIYKTTPDSKPTLPVSPKGRKPPTPK